MERYVNKSTNKRIFCAQRLKGDQMWPFWVSGRFSILFFREIIATTLPHLKYIHPGSAWVTCGKPNNHTRLEKQKKTKKKISLKMSEPEVGPEPRHLVLMTVLRVPITSSVKLTEVCEGALQPPPPICMNTHHLNPPFSPKAFLHVYEVQN